MVRRTTRHDLVDVGLSLPGLDGVRQAAVDVVLQQQQAHLVGGRGERLDLLQQVQAVGLFVDQPLSRAPAPRSGAAGSAARGGPWCTSAGSAAAGSVAVGHTPGQYAHRRDIGQSGVRMEDPMTDLEREELLEPLERALVIFSHPDDAEFSAAPTIAALTARGSARSTTW